MSAHSPACLAQAVTAVLLCAVIGWATIFGEDALRAEPPPLRVVVISQRTGNGSILEALSHAHVTDVVLLSAVDGEYPDELVEWIGNRTFSHLLCEDWRRAAQRKVATWATRMRALDMISHMSGPVLLLEEDAVLRPDPLAFSVRAGDVVRSMTSRRFDGWDLVFLGSCLESLRLVQECHRVGGYAGDTDAGLWIARAHSPACSHARLFSPAGARKARAYLRHWGAKYHERTLGLVDAQPRSCTPNALLQYRRLKSGREAWRALHIGSDQRLRQAIWRGDVAGWEVFPQIVSGRTKNEHQLEGGGLVPDVCFETLRSKVLGYIAHFKRRAR